MTLRAALVVLLSCVLHYHAASQTGTLYGTIRDAQSGENLLGANALLVGTTMGASADLDGKYEIKNIPVGTYSVRFSFVGYAPSTITGVKVEAGSRQKFDVNLQPESYTTEEVVVTAKRQLATESAILAMRKQSSRIGDGFSAEQIKKSPDATSAEALARVTGITVMDNKFVFVRGVTDRYNATQLNGVNVTSTDTDVDKRSFAYDMIPANLLENTIVAKTATPDLPGDFTGGLVQLNTIDFPEQRILKIGASLSYSSVTTFNDIQLSQGGDRDWTGIDDGSRTFPAGFEQGTVQNQPDNTNKYTLGQTLANTWAQRTGKAPLGGKLELTLGDQIDFGGSKLGMVGAFSYQNGHTRKEQEYKFYRLKGNGTIDRYNVLWGGLFDVSYKFSGLHKLSLKNSYNQSAQDAVTASFVIDDSENLRSVQVTEWDQRSLYVVSLAGDHTLPALAGADIAWRVAYSETAADEPDRRTLLYRITEDNIVKDHTDRSWADLDEFSRSLGLDITVPLANAKLKVGGLIEGRERYYGIRTFLPLLDRLSTRFDLYLLPPDSIFRPENFGRGLYIMDEISSELDEYDGTHDLYAAYAMLDIPFTLFESRFRVVGGARVENSEQLVNTISPFLTGEPYVARVKNTDVLPSVNLNYEINPVTNLRLAYGHSVNRPEFRELSSFYFYDYSTYEGVFGNPLLKRALAKNYDVRLETFPDVGEVLSASFFYKDLTDAIEMKILPSSNPERTWFNSPNGKNYGYELEFRKTLRFLGGFFSNFSLVGNYSRIYSAIEYQEKTVVEIPGGSRIDSTVNTREMQGQSPYTLNVSLLFSDPGLGTSVSLLYNRFGRRLDAVGDSRSEDIYEESRHVIDLAITQQFGPVLELKFTIRNLFPERRVLNTRDAGPYREEFVGSAASLKASVSL